MKSCATSEEIAAIESHLRWASTKVMEIMRRADNVEELEYLSFVNKLVDVAINSLDFTQ